MKKIGIIHGSSQTKINALLYECVLKAVEQLDVEVVNFGVFEEGYSYVHVSCMIGMLLESEAVDFVVTGCSSGQGMMLACNQLPHVLCGYANSSEEAYLFGRINDGNAISIPLGLNTGWSSEIRLLHILEKLFCEPFGKGYPKKDAERKQHDANVVKKLVSMRGSMVDIMKQMDKEFVDVCLSYENVKQYIMQYGKSGAIKQLYER